MTKQTTRIDLGAGTFVEAAQLAQNFQLAGGNETQKVATLLDKAADFVLDIMPEIKGGAQLMENGPRGINPVFISKDSLCASAWKRKAGNSHEVSLTVPTTLSQKLTTIAKNFNIASSLDAAQASVGLYSHLQMGLWRGNSYRLENASEKAPYFDDRKYRLEPVASF